MLISLNIPITRYQIQERCIDNEFFVLVASITVLLLEVGYACVPIYI